MSARRIIDQVAADWIAEVAPRPGQGKPLDRRSLGQRIQDALVAEGVVLDLKAWDVETLEAADTVVADAMRRVLALVDNTWGPVILKRELLRAIEGDQ